MCSIDVNLISLVCSLVLEFVTKIFFGFIRSIISMHFFIVMNFSSFIDKSEEFWLLFTYFMSQVSMDDKKFLKTIL